MLQRTFANSSLHAHFLIHCGVGIHLQKALGYGPGHSKSPLGGHNEDEGRQE